MVIRMVKHVSHLNEQFTDNAHPPTWQHLHLLVLMISSSPKRYFFIDIALLSTQQHLYQQERMPSSNQNKHPVDHQLIL